MAGSTRLENLLRAETVARFFGILGVVLMIVGIIIEFTSGGGAPLAFVGTPVFVVAFIAHQHFEMLIKRTARENLQAALLPVYVPLPPRQLYASQPTFAPAVFDTAAAA